MSIGVPCVRLARTWLLVPVVLLTAAGWISPVHAQTTTTVTPSINIVGGVAIDPAGMLRMLTAAERSDKLRELRRELVPDAMNHTVGLRKVSFRRLEAELKKCAAEGKPLPEAVSLLAGLQGIRYVLFYPEQNDIVVAGPAEGWVLDPRGYFVGVESGRPVMLLDDLLVAVRAAIRSPSVLSCSINPTPEGVRRVEAVLKQIKPGVDPRTAAAAIEEQLGPQRISVNGVPDTSHFARVMVAADYRMKRISMGLETAPIRGLPSYTEMAKGGSHASNMSPRWWLEPDYQPLVRDESALAWELRGAAVRCMTENDFFDANGVARPSGRSDPVTQRWADLMTGRYQDLAQADPVFAQLQNCMDLAVVSSLIAKRRSAIDASQQFPVLAGTDEGLPAVKLDAPKQVAPAASLAKKGKGTMIAAGGVQVDPWTLVDKAKTNADLAQVHQKLTATKNANWWWD